MDPERFTDPRAHRLARVGDRMCEVLKQGGLEDVRAVVFLTDKEGGITTMHGYHEQEADINADIEAFADVMSHLKAILMAQGKDLVLIPMEKPIGEG